MKIYLLDRDAENYRWLEYKNILVDYNGNKISLFEYFNVHVTAGLSMTDFNEVVECTTIRDKKGRTLGDFPHFALPAISEKAKNVLENYFEGLVEIFPLDVGKWGTYYFMNIMNVLDVFDTKNSIMTTLPSGIILQIKQYIFKPEIHNFNTRLFKIENDKRGPLYVNENTKQLIENAGLEGFIFTQVWDSENPDFVYEPRKIF